MQSAGERAELLVSVSPKMAMKAAGLNEMTLMAVGERDMI